MSSSPLPGPEQRRHARFPPPGWIARISMPRTWLGFGGGKAYEVKIVDLSESGVRFVAPDGIQKGTVLRVRIVEPKLREAVEERAEVIWVTPPPPVATTWIIGAEFQDPSRETRVKIMSWRRLYAVMPPGR